MSIIPLASMAPPAKHKPIGITTLVIRSCERKAESSQSNEHDNSIVRERARERKREINTLEYTAASRHDIDIDAYRSTLFQVHEPLLALEKLRRFSRVAYPPCASRQSSNASRRRENNRFSSSRRRFHRARVAIARRASVETPTLDSIRSIDRSFVSSAVSTTAPSSSSSRFVSSASHTVIVRTFCASAILSLIVD